MWAISCLSCSPSEIVIFLCSTNGQGRGARRIAGNGPNSHVPFSMCVDAAVGVTSVAENQSRDAPARCPVPEDLEHYTYQHARVALWLCFIVFVLFILGAAVGITMGGGFVV